jgi:Fe(3+) dicitrate transport protein
VKVFGSYSYTEAKYDDFEVVQRVGNNLVKASLKDKYVENAPLHILRSRLTYTYKGFSVTGQLSYVDRAFADANNTITATANGQNGVIPAYTVGDVFMAYAFRKHFTIRGGVNNVGNAAYFTRRAGGYPGPGLLPADGRNFFISVGAKF